MPTVTISLPGSLKGFIEREVETKGYGNVKEDVPEVAERFLLAVQNSIEEVPFNYAGENTRRALASIWS